MPAPSTAAYLLFIATLLGTSLFVGGLVFDFAFPNAFEQALRSCYRVDIATELDLCLASFWKLKGLWYLGGVLAVLAFSIAAIYLIPLGLKRNKGLSPAPAKYRNIESRFQKLAASAGIHPVPKLLVGRKGRLLDVLTFGQPRRYSVAIPLVMLGFFQKSGPGDALLQHEFAHVKRHDVELAWIAQSVWWILSPALLLPVVVALLSGDISLLPEYLWRVVVIGLVVQVVAARMLRSREYFADLTSARRLGAPDIMKAALLWIPQQPRQSLLASLLSRHPPVAKREKVLDQPAHWARFNLFDAVAAGFLAAFTMPLIKEGWWAVSGGSGGWGGLVVGGMLTGSLLGIVVGFGLWRSEVFLAASVGSAHLSQPSSLVVGSCTGLGAFAGQISSLASSGTATPGVFNMDSLIVPILGCVAAVALSNMLNRIPMALARRARRPWHAWLPAMGLNVVLFVTAVWVWTLLQIVVDSFREEGASADLLRFGFACALVLALLSGIIDIRRRTTPPEPNRFAPWICG